MRAGSDTVAFNNSIRLLYIISHFSSIVEHFYISFVCLSPIGLCRCSAAA